MVYWTVVSQVRSIDSNGWDNGEARRARQSKAVGLLCKNVLLNEQLVMPFGAFSSALVLH